MMFEQIAGPSFRASPVVDEEQGERGLKEWRKQAPVWTWGAGLKGWPFPGGHGPREAEGRGG